MWSNCTERSSRNNSFRGTRMQSQSEILFQATQLACQNAEYVSAVKASQLHGCWFQFYLLWLILELSVCLQQNVDSQWYFFISCGLKDAYCYCCYANSCTLRIDLVQTSQISSKCCFALNSTADSRFIIMLMEADLKGFWNYGSGMQNESQAYFSVGPHMSEVSLMSPW